MSTGQMIDSIQIRSVSDRLCPDVKMPGFGESRRSVAKADGGAWGWGPMRTK
jgi:hypothetical protein